MLRYAVTIFLGAFLLFLVQPMIGKYILPWFGGGSGVWTACLLFFQTVLLVGYAYAHLVIRYMPGAKTQAIVHVVVLAAGLAFLPIVPGEFWKPQTAADPTWRILLLLSATLGVPYVALAATSPLLQAWFARTHPGTSPYRLYALSNVGSLLALLGYPFLMEPNASRSVQASIWSGGFVVFAIACGYCALRLLRSPVDAVVQARSESRADAVGHARGNRAVQSSSLLSAADCAETAPARIIFDRTLWIILPALASTLLMAVTTILSEEVAPIPFLWVLPLSVYLLTFIITFEYPRLYYRPMFVPAIIAAPWLVFWRLADPEMDWGIGAQIAVYVAVLFVCCMVCHGEVYRRRPPAAQLTSYYLCLAAGGALGGAFVALAAPIIFTSYLEFYLGLYGTIAILLAVLLRDPASIFHGRAYRAGWLVLIMMAVLTGFLIRMRTSALAKHVALQTRNFYGTLSLRVQPAKVPEGEFRKLEHGRISHGAQYQHRAIVEWQLQPTMYYVPTTGVGMVLTQRSRPGLRNVGVVGLGVGTVAVYGERGDSYRFYEINPEVERFAETYFTFLSDARQRGVDVQVVLGDARLSLERQSPQRFDILILDAFSGDAIPIHLLTKEVFDTYVRHLADDGVIAVNVTNRYLELHPIVEALGASVGLECAFVDSPADDANMVPAAHWVLLTRNQAMLQRPDIRAFGVHRAGAPHVPLWTDDQASLFPVLR